MAIEKSTKETGSSSDVDSTISEECRFIVRGAEEELGNLECLACKSESMVVPV